MKAALIQLRVSEREMAERRWERVEQILSELEGQQIDLIILPELWSVGFSNFDRYEQEAEPLHGTTVLRLAAWAKRLHCYILTGSFVERKENRLYNTMALLDGNGFLVGTYQKIHLFGFDSLEQQLLTPGQRTSEMYTSYGIFGLATCYDLRFPEQFRYMVEHGATAFVVSAAWPRERLEEWRLFCQVRALENQSFLLACNHAGDIHGCIGAGHSMIVAPNGTILAEAEEGEEILRQEIDLNEVQRFRKQFPALRDRVTIQ